jgi:anti-sigma B factor antagonist
MSGLDISVAHIGSECVIRVSGEVDVENAEDLASVAVLAASSTEAGYLVIDLDGVPFMDSAGLGALVRIRNAARVASRGVVLRGLRPRVVKVIKITGVADLFTIEPTGEDATTGPDAASISSTA